MTAIDYPRTTSGFVNRIGSTTLGLMSAKCYNMQQTS